jgi:hypothetical protein
MDLLVILALAFMAAIAALTRDPGQCILVAIIIVMARAIVGSRACAKERAIVADPNLSKLRLLENKMDQISNKVERLEILWETDKPS